MGHEIEEAAHKRGHSAGLIVDVDNIADLNPEKLKGVDVAIEFSSPDSAYENIMACLRNGTPVVSGTTGWLGKYDDAVKICMEKNTSFIHSSNFSIGVNLFFRINSELARLIGPYNDYSCSIEEIHHTKKLDAPSGTAITIAQKISANHPRYDGWSMETANVSEKIPVRAVREGNVPGTHIVEWNSGIDRIELKHEAFNRKGFAVGAVVAAEYIAGRRGVFTMTDVLGF